MTVDWKRKKIKTKRVYNLKDVSMSLQSRSLISQFVKQYILKYNLGIFGLADRQTQAINNYMGVHKNILRLQN